MDELIQYAGCDDLLLPLSQKIQQEKEQEWFEQGMLILEWSFWIRVLLDDLMGNPP